MVLRDDGHHHYPGLPHLAASWPMARRQRMFDIRAPREPDHRGIQRGDGDRTEDRRLELDYPPDKLEIFVASDGSTDRTDSIVESYSDRGIVLANFQRTGKTGVQNRMAVRATGDILVFSDANAFYKPDAIRMLVRNFADPGIGGVCGRLEYLVAGEGAGSSESTYTGGTRNSSRDARANCRR